MFWNVYIALKIKQKKKMVHLPVLGALKPKQFLICLGFRSERKEQREPSSMCPLEQWIREGCQSQLRGVGCAETITPALQLSALSHPLRLLIWGAGGVEEKVKKVKKVKKVEHR